MKQKVIFIFAYYSFKDPVFQSAVLPYFTDFPHKDQYQFILLTFEQEKYRLGKEEEEEIKKDLARENIIWHIQKWHSGSFKFVKKIYDVIVGLSLSYRLVHKYKADAVYSEAFPGAVIAHFVAKLSRRPHIVHTFEPHTDYMVEAGVWKADSWEARLLGLFERVVARGAETIMTATQAMIDRLKKAGVMANIIRVPSCVDIQHFRFLASERLRLRQKFGITDGEIVIIYLGKLGGMYWDTEIFDFFSACLQVSDRFRFFFFTPDSQQLVEKYASQFHIPKEKFTIGFLSRSEVPAYLSAADWGLVPVRQYPGKRFCSPIKDGEYWACELPIIIPEGISDDYLVAEKSDIGIVLQTTTKEEYTKAAKKIIQLTSDINKMSDMRQRCRFFVEHDRDITRFHQCYKQVFDRL